jgi:hypothetical protein
VIFDGQKLTKQQAVDLITIIPCLVWIFDVLSEYSLSDGWHGQEIRGDLPSPHHTWLTDQIDASTATKAGHTDTAPNKGIVIDLPDRNFARIRSQGRDIICAPVNSLPDRIELGSEVTFETTQRYGSYYGKNITVANNPVTNVAQDAETIITFEETEDDFLIPKPVSELATETAVEIVLDILDSVCLQTAITNELVQRLLLSIESQSEHYDELLQNLLKDTPFDPAIFSDLVGEIHTHHRIPRDDLSFRTLPLALCVSFFYRSIDDEKAVLKADMQGDSSVFYERDDECLIVGNRLVWKAFNTEPTEAPRSIRDAITVTNRNRKLVVPVNKAITALCERQFHLNCPSGDTLTSEILKHGLQETGAAVIYLSLENT